MYETTSALSVNLSMNKNRKELVPEVSQWKRECFKVPQNTVVISIIQKQEIFVFK